MSQKDKLIEVGKCPTLFGKILGVDLPDALIYYSREGLEAHMRNHHHENCIPYIDMLTDMILNPDFIGINPKEKGTSFEVVKMLDENILVGVKFDVSGDYYYVPTIYEIQPSKMKRRVHSQRLKPVSEKNVELLDK